MKNTLKIFIWNLLGRKIQQIYLSRKLIKSQDYQKLRESMARKRVLLLDTPEHGNLGDHAIVLAMKKFVQIYFPEQEIYEFTSGGCDTFAGRRFFGNAVAQGRGKCAPHIKGVFRIQDYYFPADTFLRRIREWEKGKRTVFICGGDLQERFFIFAG